jgi:hypothetical protein
MVTVYVVEYLWHGALDMYEVFATRESADDRKAGLDSTVEYDDEGQWFRVREVTVNP